MAKSKSMTTHDIYSAQHLPHAWRPALFVVQHVTIRTNFLKCYTSLSVILHGRPIYLDSKRWKCCKRYEQYQRVSFTWWFQPYKMELQFRRVLEKRREQKSSEARCAITSTSKSFGITVEREHWRVHHWEKAFQKVPQWSIHNTEETFEVRRLNFWSPWRYSPFNNQGEENIASGLQSKSTMGRTSGRSAVPRLSSIQKRTSILPEYQHSTCSLP